MPSVLMIGDLQHDQQLQQVHAKLVACHDIDVDNVLEVKQSLNKVYDIYIYDKQHNPTAFNSQSTKQAIYASTHHGVEILDIAKIQYFVADQKYVNAIHADGVLLISDSLVELEQKFPDQFIRVHRKYLVASKLICSLIKSEERQFVLKLHQVAKPIPVSRRKLAQVRKFIKNCAAKAL